MGRKGNHDNDQKELDKLIEEITVDAYGEDEQFSALILIPREGP
jgi:hypothetical protein